MEAAAHALDAETLDEAKAAAAILYAGASFRPTPPTSYKILCETGSEVYRFPEHVPEHAVDQAR